MSTHDDDVNWPQFRGSCSGRHNASKENLGNTPKEENLVVTVAERLAIELHRQYRAAEKALNGPRSGEELPLAHDHGWEHCNKKAYFTKRAELIIKRAAVRNPDTLGEAEQALDATVLRRRLQVEGKIPFDTCYADAQRIAKRNLETVTTEKWFAHGGYIPPAHDYHFKFDFDTPLLSNAAVPNCKALDIVQLASWFQVPVHLLTGTIGDGDAREKAKRDAEVRKVLNAPSPGTFTRTYYGARSYWWGKPVMEVKDYHFSKVPE